MTVTFNKMVGWTSPAGAFEFAIDPQNATLKTPDGSVLTLPLEEWRNLRTALAELTSTTSTRPRRDDLPAAQGKAWTAADDAELERLWQQTKSVPALAERFQRTRNSITARLRKRGIETNPPGESADGPQPPDPDG